MSILNIQAPTQAEIQNAAQSIANAGIDLSQAFIEEVSQQLRLTIPSIREVAQIQGVTMQDRTGGNIS